MRRLTRSGTGEARSPHPAGITRHDARAATASRREASPCRLIERPGIGATGVADAGFPNGKVSLRMPDVVAVVDGDAAVARQAGSGFENSRVVFFTVV